MKRWIRWIGSIKIAVPLLVTIAAVLAWGTIYEARFGTAAVQRFIYASWWFQAVLAFLGVNLAVAAIDRYPWKPKHAPFLLAHLGIILILTGGIIGGRFGTEGQMIIPEGQATRTLEMPGSNLIIHDPESGSHQIIPTRFESQAWVHELNLTFPVRFARRSIDLTVDRYYPDPVMTEDIANTAEADNPAVHLRLEHGEELEEVWLLARDPDRFGVGWGEAHVLFLEPQSDAQLAQLTGKAAKTTAARGVISLKLPKIKQAVTIPVPEHFTQPVDIPGTDYRVTFKDYFADFVMTAEGLSSRSDSPDNPAVSFVLSGPEGEDAYLLFAMHPDFQSMHGFKHAIAAEASYTHESAGGSLPSQSIAIIKKSSGELMAVLTQPSGERTTINSVKPGEKYTHDSLGYGFELLDYLPRAQVTQRFDNRSDEIHGEALHVSAKEGGQSAEGWVTMRNSTELNLGGKPIVVEYAPAKRDLPMSVKLLDFRKIDYPGTDMPQAFESDVELSDLDRGVILMRKVYMNHPLRYRGYSFFQSSYIDGPTQTTILSVRNDPGCPFVYAGFIIVILGVVNLFVLRSDAVKNFKWGKIGKRGRR